MVRNESVISDLTADTSMMTATPIKDNNAESVATTTDKEMIDGKENKEYKENEAGFGHAIEQVEDEDVPFDIDNDEDAPFLTAYFEQIGVNTKAATIGDSIGVKIETSSLTSLDQKSDRDQQSAGEGSETGSLNEPVSFDFAKQEQLIEALKAEEEPVSDEHDSEEEEMAIMTLVRNSSDSRGKVAYGVAGDGEYNDLPIPLQGPITKDIYLCIGQVQEEELLDELSADICETLIAEYVKSRVTSYVTHVLEGFEREFYLEKEAIDKEKVTQVAGTIISKQVVMTRLLYHIADQFNTLLLEHVLRGVFTREIAKRCTSMLLSVEEQQERLLVSKCPYNGEKTRDFIDRHMKKRNEHLLKEREQEQEKTVTSFDDEQEHHDKTHSKLGYYSSHHGVKESEIWINPRPQPSMEHLLPLNVEDRESSTTVLKKLLFRSSIPTIAESLLHSFKNTNAALLDEVDEMESYGRGHVVTGTEESLYVKSSTGKIITSQFYDYHSDHTTASASLSAYVAFRQEAKGESSTKDDAEEYRQQATVCGVEVEDLPSFAASHARINASGQAGAKINLQDTLARLRRKRKAKMLLRYQSTRSNNAEGGGSDGGKTSYDKESTQHNMPHSHYNHHQSLWEKVTYQDKDDSSDF